MAISSGGTLGTGASSTSASSYTFTTATNTLAAGDFAILVATSDNIATVDGTGNNDHTNVSGGAGEWRKLGEYTNSPTGAAGDGVTNSVWLFLATGAVGTGTTITLSLAANATDKCCAFWKFTKAANTEILKVPGITNPITSEVNAANDFGSSAFSSLASAARLYLRGLGKEANSTTALTVSTNFTEITGTRSRNNANAVIVRGEFRINTSTGETSNPTLAVSGDSAGLFFALVESALPVANVGADQLNASATTADRIGAPLPFQEFIQLVERNMPVANVAPEQTIDGAPPTPRIGAPQAYPNLLLSTLVPVVVVSTDQVRSPLYQQRKWPPQVVAAQQHNLLLTTLGAGTNGSITLTGVAATGSASAPSARVDVAITLSGAASTGAISGPALSVDTATTIIGVSGSGTAGSPATSVSAAQLLAGVSGSGSAGAPQAVVDVALALGAVQATGSVSSPSIASSPTVSLSGVAGAGAVSGPSLTVDTATALIGVSSSGSAGSPALVVDAAETLVGVAVSGQADSPAASVDTAQALSGVQADANAGAPQALSEPTVPITGVEALGQVSEPSAFGDTAIDGSTTLSGVEASGQAGDLAASQEAAVLLTGVQAQGDASALSAQPTAASIELGGVQATGEVGSLSAVETSDAAVELSGVAAQGEVESLAGQVDVFLGGSPPAEPAIILPPPVIQSGGLDSAVVYAIRTPAEVVEITNAHVALAGVAAAAQLARIEAAGEQRADAIVMLGGVSAQIVPLRPNRPGPPRAAPDPELDQLAREHYALLASGWR